MTQTTHTTNTASHFGLLACGSVLALAGIMLCAVAPSTLLVVFGLLLLLPAGAFLSMGLCRISLAIVAASGMKVSAMPAILNREATAAGALRLVGASVSGFAGHVAKTNQRQAEKSAQESCTALAA